MTTTTERPHSDCAVSFPIGYHGLHPNVSMNFQMNRWYGWVGEPEMLAVGAVFDYFKVERAALVGLSLGGCLVLRAAALEPRIECVVAYDIFTNGLEITLRQTHALLRGLLKILLRLGAARIVNWMAPELPREVRSCNEVFSKECT